MNTLVISNEHDYKIAKKHLDKLLEVVMDKREENVTQETLGEIKLYSLIISDYEDALYPIKAPDPVSAIKFAMEQYHLRPIDMAEYFGSPSRYYDVLNGKKS